MTDRPLLEKRLAIIDTSLAELRRLAHVDRIDVDIREQRFVEHTLQVAIQAALDVASHIVSDRRLGEPATNRDSFLLLERDGWIISPSCEGHSPTWPGSATSSCTAMTKSTWRSCGTW